MRLVVAIAPDGDTLYVASADQQDALIVLLEKLLAQARALQFQMPGLSGPH